jgi:hypothetical protein
MMRTVPLRPMGKKQRTFKDRVHFSMPAAGRPGQLSPCPANETCRISLGSVVYQWWRGIWETRGFIMSMATAGQVVPASGVRFEKKICAQRQIKRRESSKNM